MTETVVARTDFQRWLLRAWEQGTHPVFAAGLSGLALAYRTALLAREPFYALGVLRSGRLPVPVVSVGNLTVGGSGKTPLVELAAQTLAELGAVPGIVSRGYRRDTRGALVVADRDGLRAGPRAAGDEPVLLAERLPGIPVVVGENRYQAGRIALERLGATAIVLDDGFQNRTIVKDVEVLAVSGRSPWGNGHLFPAGPLREPLTALRRAHIVVVTNDAGGAGITAVAQLLARLRSTAPVVTAGYRVIGVIGVRDAQRGQLGEPGALAGRRLVGFAGLAAPRGFRDTLSSMGVTVADFIEFPDHHWYGPDDLDSAARRVDLVGADGLVTTEKDAIRLRDLPLPRRPLWVVSVKMALRSGHAEWLGLLRRALDRSLART